MALEIFLSKNAKKNNRKIYKWEYSNNYNIPPGNLFTEILGSVERACIIQILDNKIG